jgi:hypothetical protein
MAVDLPAFRPNRRREELISFPLMVALKVKQRLVKTGGRLLKHARYYWLLLAESHLTRRLFGAMVRRIELLPLPAG